VTDVFESRFLNGITSIIEVVLNRALKRIIHNAYALYLCTEKIMVMLCM